MHKGFYAMAIVLSAAVGAGAMWLAGANGVGLAAGAERARVEGIVRDYVLANPEIIPEALQRLQARETGKSVAANRPAIETPFGGAWAGNPDGDVTVVEFYDYACGYCRRSLADVNRLIAEDRNVRVVFRELPLLSPESEVAARASLAAAEAGPARFRAFHDTLFSTGRPSEATIRAAGARAGITPATLAATRTNARYTRELATNLALARQVGATGVPSWVVGDQMLSGAIGYEGLKRAVAAARAAR